jgi:hypothetical protein
MDKRFEGKQAYEQLLKSCLSIDSQADEKKLFSLKSDFLKSFQTLHKQVAAFKDSIVNIPLSAMVLLWGELICDDKVFGSRYLGMLRELIEKGLLPLIAGKKKTITLQDLAQQDPSSVIEKIRCYSSWDVSRREDCVLLYTTFSEWLSKETFGYIPEAKDLDRIATQKRQIPFDTYIKILSHMDLREQILAKMFYLGGSRGLEEVLSVEIKQIDFSRFLIHFSDDISYPQHLFGDIKEYIQNRKKGYVFVGRNEERISTTTPFRTLKKIASDLGLGAEFTFKDFTKNV